MMVTNIESSKIQVPCIQLKEAIAPQKLFLSQINFRSPEKDLPPSFRPNIAMAGITVKDVNAHGRNGQRDLYRILRH